MSEEQQQQPTQACGWWQCPHCFITSGFMWSGKPNPDDAPSCCRGERMVAYRIVPQPTNEKGQR